MATTPNRYFNSPWIEAAGRNLASALAPPDPDKVLAREQIQQEMADARTKAEYTRTDREHRFAADAKLQELLGMAPVMGADGKIDEDATEAQARALMGEVIKLGGTEDYYKSADLAAGTASPTYAAKSALKQQAIDAARASQYAGFANALQLQGNQFRQQSLIQDDDQAFRAEQQQKNLDAAWDRESARLQNAADIANAKLKATGAGGTPPVVFGQLEKDIVRGVLKKVQDSGLTISRRDLDKMYALAGTYAQQFRNAQAGVNLAWEETVERPKGGADKVPTTGAGTVNAPGRWARAFSSTSELEKRTLHPAFPGDELVTEETPTLGGAVTQTPPIDASSMIPPAPAPAPAATAPTPSRRPPNVPKGASKKPPEGAHSKDKNGRPTIFRNGRWEYL